MTLTKEFTPEELRAAVEHRDALIDIREILSKPSGRRFFKYLFRALDAAQLPEFGLEDRLLYERIGFLRAGNSIFKLTAEANRELAGQILAEIEKERYDQLYKEQELDGPKADRAED